MTTLFQAPLEDCKNPGCFNESSVMHVHAVFRRISYNHFGRVHTHNDFIQYFNQLLQSRLLQKVAESLFKFFSVPFYSKQIKTGLL